MCAVLVFLALGAVAVASIPSSPTKVVLDQFTQTGEGPTLHGKFVGHLESPKEKCVRGRTIKLFLRNGNNGKTKLADTDHTGKRGGWTVEGDLFTIDRAQIKATRKVIGSGDNRRVCKADKLTRFFA
jgi:hypothetical protein